MELAQSHMVHCFPRPDVIDKVWSIASDGQWVSIDVLMKRARCRADDVAAALHFLIKYGFAESSTVGEESVRMITEGPSPMEAVNLLRAVEIEPY